MTILTIRSRSGHFIITGTDINPIKFKTRRQARDWCAENYPDLPIHEAGPDAVRRATKTKIRRDLNLALRRP
jgi:hypothetical protein